MPQVTRGATRLLLFTLLAMGGTLHAQTTVTDDGFSFSPDPVYIVTGEAVYWVDDGSGPYLISSDTGAWTPFETPGGILFDQQGTYSYHDDAGDFGTIYVSPNAPPTVDISNPTNNAVLAVPATFTFSADAADSDDGLSDVEFYVGTNLVDDVFFSPFATGVTNLPAGTYTLTAIAYDNVGATATNSVTIFVQNNPITLAPSAISSGEFQFSVAGLTAGKTNILEGATDLVSGNWVPIATNVAAGSSMSFTNAASAQRYFFRLLQLP